MPHVHEDRPEDPAVAHAAAEARFREQRLQLHRARAYAGKPSSARRLRDLEQEAGRAREALARARAASDRDA